MTKSIEEKIQLLSDNYTATDISAHTGIPTNTLYRVFRNETSIDKTRYEVIRKLEAFYELNRELLEHPNGSVILYDKYTKDNIFEAIQALATSILHLHPHVQMVDLYNRSDSFGLFETKPCFRFAAYQAQLVARIVSYGYPNDKDSEELFNELLEVYQEAKKSVPVTVQFSIEETHKKAKRVFTYRRKTTAKRLNGTISVFENTPIFSIIVDAEKAQEELLGKEILQTLYLIDNVVQAYGKRHLYEMRCSQHYVILEDTIFKNQEGKEDVLKTIGEPLVQSFLPYTYNESDGILVHDRDYRRNTVLLENRLVSSETISIQTEEHTKDNYHSIDRETLRRFQDVFEIVKGRVTLIEDMLPYALERLFEVSNRNIFHVPTSASAFNLYRFQLESRLYENSSNLFFTLHYNGKVHFRMRLCTLSVDEASKNTSLLREKTDELKNVLHAMLSDELEKMKAEHLEDETYWEYFKEDTNHQFYIAPIDKLTLR